MCVNTLQALAPLLKKHKSGYLEDARKHYAKVRKEFDARAVGNPGKTPIHPQYLTQSISDLAAADAVFTCDVGTPTTCAARYLKMNGARRLLGSFNHGTMANAMPQAIGVQATFPTRQVVSLSGDGGFSMLMGDLLTLRQAKLPVKIVVYNNSAYGFVEQEMKAADIQTFGTEFVPTDFAAIAEGAGIRGWRVETPEQVKPALAAAFAHPGPALIDVVVNRQELSLPPTITARPGRRLQPLHAEGHAPRRRPRGGGHGEDKPDPVELMDLHQPRVTAGVRGHRALLRRAPMVDVADLVDATDRAVRRTRLLRQKLALDVSRLVAGERHPRIPALLRAIVNEAKLADIEVAPTRAAAPVVRQTVGNGLLEVVEAGVAPPGQVAHPVPTRPVPRRRAVSTAPSHRG